VYIYIKQRLTRKRPDLEYLLAKNSMNSRYVLVWVVTTSWR